MNTTEKQNIIANAYTTQTRDDGSEYVGINPATPAGVREKLLQCQHDSGLSFEFSYIIAEKACEVLTNATRYVDISDNIDGVLPIYTSEIMKIYLANSHIVDEGVEELGDPQGGSSEQRALLWWYNAIDAMSHSIADALELFDDEDEDTK